MLHHVWLWQYVSKRRVICQVSKSFDCELMLCRLETISFSQLSCLQLRTGNRSANEKIIAKYWPWKLCSAIRETFLIHKSIQVLGRFIKNFDDFQPPLQFWPASIFIIACVWILDFSEFSAQLPFSRGRENSESEKFYQCLTIITKTTCPRPRKTKIRQQKHLCRS